MLLGQIWCCFTFFSLSAFQLHQPLFVFSGVQILERTTVQQVLVEKGHVTAVETDRGSIECDYFVNCAGQVNPAKQFSQNSFIFLRKPAHIFLFLSSNQWAYELGQASETKVSVPLHGCEHFYLLTKPLQEPLPGNMPGLQHKTHKNIFIFFVRLHKCF